MFQRPLLFALLTTLALSGCASSLSGNTYERRQARTAQSVELGVVDSVRVVQIEGTKSGVGAAAGGIVGSVAGGQAGHGPVGRTLGSVAGGVLGGVAGAATEEGITRQKGYEITVRLENGRLMAVVQAADEEFRPGERVRVLSGGGTTRVTH